MTGLERKQQTERILETLGITILDDLPPLEEEAEVRLRTPQEIAQRILILTYLNCIASDKNLSEGVVAFLKQESLWEKASGKEKDLFLKAQLTEEEENIIRWRGESIWLLLWTIYKVPQLDFPVDETDPNDVFALLPKFMKDTSDFINTASTRSVSEILDQADFIFRLNWAMHKSETDTATVTLHPAIAYERYFAIGWVTSLRPRWEDVDE